MNGARRRLSSSKDNVSNGRLEDAMEILPQVHTLCLSYPYGAMNFHGQQLYEVARNLYRSLKGMGEGRMFKKKLLASLFKKTYRMNLLLARSISLDITFNCR